MAKDSWKYHPIALDSRNEFDEIIVSPSRYDRRQRYLLRGSIILSISATLFTIFFYTSHLFPSTYGSQEGSLAEPRRCQKPALRIEWRTLDNKEKDAYISAVQCLMHQPSIFRPETSYYDDFIFAHSKTGTYSHYAAAFLPWHRMFIHLYEQALRKQCNYKGAFPYWDWTLDSGNLSASPIWDTDHGFGGNGDVNGPVTLHNGHCVVNGPFSNTIRAWNAVSEGHSHDIVYSPHCLSRGFVSTSEQLDKLRRLILPDYIQNTLNQPDYASFFKMFEQGAHNAIPQFIRGDWLTFTAPNDPVFFLHHTQVDRLWWLWQEQEPEIRFKEFHGPKEDFRLQEHHNVSDSSMADMVPTGGLAQDRSVADFMDTASGLLCYRY